MPILYGIDGTGPFFDTTYAQNFANSHVRRICASGDEYSRGPIGPGGGLPEAIEAGMSVVLQKRRAFESQNEQTCMLPHLGDILLTGYSRGGLGVLEMARRLKGQNIPVKAIMLFDAVDRHAAYDAESVPNNVEHVLHVRRDPQARSRMSFGNCGTKFSPPTKYSQKFFWCTHGAMGGTPWTLPQGVSSNEVIQEGTLEDAYLRDWNARTNVTYAVDAARSVEIWNYCQSFLSTHKFV